jgi:hypothetical protein
MPRFTCGSCSAWLYSATATANLANSTCPRCGAQLPSEPEADPLETVSAAALATP